MDYKNSKIYAIKSDLTDKIYIGSTTQRLCKRFSQHKNNKNSCSSLELFQLGDCYIELIELFSCSCKEELIKKEGEIIRQFKDVVINKRISGRKKEEYYKDNKEKIKEYREKNKEKIKDYQKEYQQKNKEKINQKQRKYYQRKNIDI